MQPTPQRVDTSIGTLLLFPQRFEDIGAFSKLDADESAVNRLRAYLPSIAARDDAAIERGTPVRIDPSSCAQLPEGDIERIAEAYLSLSEVRQMEQRSATAPNACVRSQGEAASAYLDRLLQANHERQMLDPRATFESFHDPEDVPPAGALEDLDRQSASLRHAAEDVIRDDRARHATPVDSTLSLGAGRPSEREEEIALARGNARISTQSALLLASLEPERIAIPERICRGRPAFGRSHAQIAAHRRDRRVHRGALLRRRAGRCDRGLSRGPREYATRGTGAGIGAARGTGGRHGRAGTKPGTGGEAARAGRAPGRDHGSSSGHAASGDGTRDCASGAA